MTVRYRPEQIYQRWVNWLESRWVVPAFSGWVLGGLATFFFTAAINTMAGWLYVISGGMMALLGIAVLLPRRSLRGIHVTRRPLRPVYAGQPLQVELLLENRHRQAKTLLQVQDVLPSTLGKPVHWAIEAIPAEDTYAWRYEHPTPRRGIYRWHTVHLRTAAPLGLFWHRQSQIAEARAVVYPQVWPLTRCPIVDELGQDVNAQVQPQFHARPSTDGLTRALRPYRWGDPTRLIHWRTSARYGDLRVREVEIQTGGQDVVIGLDTTEAWHPENFEQAVIAAASLYQYARHHRLPVKLWTAKTGMIQGDRAVFEALAATEMGQGAGGDRPPQQPMLWLTQQPSSLESLPPGSRWLVWLKPSSERGPSGSLPLSSSGHLMQPDQPLQLQLQMPVP